MAVFTPFTPERCSSASGCFQDLVAANSFPGQCSVLLPVRRLFPCPCFLGRNSANLNGVGDESWTKAEWATHAKVYINFHHQHHFSDKLYLWEQDPRTACESEISCLNKYLKENVVNPFFFSPVLSYTFPHSLINLQKCLVYSIWEMVNNVKSVVLHSWKAVPSSVFVDVPGSFLFCQSSFCFPTVSAFSKSSCTPHLLPSVLNRFLIWDGSEHPRPFKAFNPCHRCLFLSFKKCYLQLNAFCRRLTFSEFPPGQTHTFWHVILFDNGPIYRGGEIKSWSSGYSCHIALFMAKCYGGSAVGSYGLFASDIKVTIRYFQTSILTYQEQVILSNTEQSKQPEKKPQTLMLDLSPMQFLKKIQPRLPPNIIQCL